MFACLYVPDFSVQAALLPESADAREILWRSPIVILDGPANLLKVTALNDPARKIGLEAGMTKLQVETRGGVLLRKRSLENENSAQTELLECANFFSPRVESTCLGTAILDLAGTKKLFGSSQNTAQKLAWKARERGFLLHIAIAANPDAAMFAARGFPGITVIPPGEEARHLAGLSVAMLPVTPEMLETLDGWGIRTFKALAALPEVPLTERLGQASLHLQRLARGQIDRVLKPVELASKFIESFEFDDPIETLESLTFVLNRLLEQLCDRLLSHSLATNNLRLTLELEVRQRQNENKGEEYKQEWKLPVPTQERKVLFTLVRLDLERNAFSAPIKKVTIEALPMKPRLAQGNLFAPPSPEAERLEITLARIRGVVGSVDANGLSCAGSPGIVDTHNPISFSVQPFSSVADISNSVAAPGPVIALRVFRPTLETSVELTGETPHFVRLWKKHYRVLAASGPWCSSGEWWNSGAWARQEWDVALKTRTGVGYYRIYEDRIKQQWFVEGIFD